MKSHPARLMRLALVGTLVAGGVSALGRVAHADLNALRAKAQTELTTVTREVDKANEMFSPADHSAGFNLAKNAQYQREYEAGVKSFNAGRYADAMQHLSNATGLSAAGPIGITLSSQLPMPASSSHFICSPDPA